MDNYKEHIELTRKGNVGSSDAKMLAQIAELGSVPKSANKRLAIVKGLIENENFTTSAMRYGDFIENEIFKYLKSEDGTWQSNPCLVSKKYSRENVKCIDHVDFMRVDDEKKTVTIVECKATKMNFTQTRTEYKAQLAHHYLLGKEYAQSLGGYTLKVLLCHYDSSHQNLDEEFEFNPEWLTIKQLRFNGSNTYDLGKAMDLIDAYLETFDVYSFDEEIPYQILPDDAKKTFDRVTALLTEIKEREKAVDSLKSKLFNFFTEKNIKSIKNKQWSITRIDPTESKRFDAKKYLEDFSSAHPVLYKKLKSKYEKTVKKNGYIQIKINEQ